MCTVFRGSSFYRIFSVLLVVVVVSGCGGGGGPELAAVTGKLTKGGKPLGSVSVTFTSNGGSHSSAALTDSEGRFVLLSSTGKAGAVPGKHKVTLAVRAAGNGGGAVDYAAMAKARDASVGKNGAPKKADDDKSFPPEYGDPAKTPLEYEVKAGSNDFDIVIP